MNDNPRPTDDYADAKALIDGKVASGIFWSITKAKNDTGALADARKLAWKLVRKGDVLGALSLMIEVHAKAVEFSEEILRGQPAGWMWGRWHFQSRCAEGFYTALQQTLLFFGSF